MKKRLIADLFIDNRWYLLMSIGIFLFIFAFFVPFFAAFFEVFLEVGIIFLLKNGKKFERAHWTANICACQDFKSINSRAGPINLPPVIDVASGFRIDISGSFPGNRTISILQSTS